MRMRKYSEFQVIGTLKRVKIVVKDLWVMRLNRVNYNHIHNKNFELL